MTLVINAVTLKKGERYQIDMQKKKVKIKLKVPCYKTHYKKIEI